MVAPREVCFVVLTRQSFPIASTCGFIACLPSQCCSLYCSFHGVCVVGFSVVNTQFDDVACNGFRGAPEKQSRGIQDQIVAEEVISSVDEEVFAERQLGRMCTRRGCGWLATAQATALVDVPTALHFFGCGPKESNACASFCANAWLCARQATDRDLDSSNTMKKVNDRDLDSSNTMKKVNASTCASPTTDHDLQVSSPTRRENLQPL